MTRDLRSALTDIVQQTADEQTTRIRDHAGLDAGAIAHRAGRARTRRAAVTTATALVAVVAVVFAGSALADRRDPLPAETPTVAPSPSVTTPAPTPTPTETTPTVVLPTGDPSLPFGVCGSLADAAPAAPWTDHATVWRDVPVTEVAAGARLTVSASVGPADGTDVLAVPADGPQIAVLRDGVVVGTAVLHDPRSAAWSLSDGMVGSRIHGDQIVLSVCGPDGRPDVTAGMPLPAGTYDLLPWASVARLPADTVSTTADLEDAFVQERGTPATVRSEAVAVTVTGQSGTTTGRARDGAPSAPAGAVTEPLCGEPAPTVAGPGDLQVEVVSEEPLTWGLRYDGPGRARGWLAAGAWQFAVRDGVVVGSNHIPIDIGAEIDLAYGPSIDIVDQDPLYSCAAGDYSAPLEPGEYLVYPGLYVMLDDRVLPDGTVVPGEGGTWVIGEPITRTVG